jgi:protein O-GlcNAc transferase
MADASISKLMQEAVRHQVQGRLAEAKAAFEKILAQSPQNSEVLNLLGVVYFQSGQRPAGLEMIRKSIALEPNNADRYTNLAYILAQGGDFPGAAEAYRKAIELNPKHFEAHYSLGLLLFQLRQIEAAVAEYRAALKIRPGAFNAAHNLGIALRNQGKLDESLMVLRQAVGERTKRTDVLSDLAITLQGQGRIDESIEATQAVIAGKPDLASAYNTLGGVLVMKGNFDEALAAVQKSVELAPKDGSYKCNFAGILKDIGRIEESPPWYTEAMALDPINPAIHCNWVYVMHFHPAYGPEAIFDEARRWNARHAIPLTGEQKPHRNDRSPTRRLRVGFVSPDFRGHAIGRSLVALFRHHNREQFEFFGYSDVGSPDRVTADLERFSDSWQKTIGLSHARLCETVRNDRIDIFFDLTLHMNNNRLLAFAARPAPVQITWAGYPGTSGMDAMDYRLTDSHMDPPGQTDQYYSEKSLRLENSFWCLDRETMEHQANADVTLLPSLKNGHTTFGCLNNFCKVNSGVLKMWKRVLDAVPGSRMLLLAHEGSPRHWVRQTLGDRVDFVARLPHADYLKTYQQFDIGLDTLPYNGHMTTLDSLWMGVPVVSITGTTAVGRGGLSILRNIGLPELVASSEDEFVATAANLAGDLARLESLRRSLRERMCASVLMDGVKFVRNFESILRSAWEN